MSEPHKCKENGRIYGYESCTSHVDEEWVPKCICKDGCQYTSNGYKKQDYYVERAAQC